MRPLTERQNEILDYIKTFINQNRYSPTLREIAGHFHITPKGAQNFTIALEKKGYIESQRGKPRTITIKESNYEN
jgi:repressor LexA